MKNQISQNDKKWTLISAILASGVVFLGFAMVHLALPSIGTSLDIGLSGLQWVMNAYLLTLSSLLILGGVLGDRYGNRKICLIGLTGYALTTLGAALSPTFQWLITMRVIQGISAALFVPESLALIRSVYTNPKYLGEAIGTWTGWTGVATVAGSLLGGAVVDQFSWRWAFLINLPLTGYAIWLMIKHVPENTAKTKAVNPDWIGAALITFGLFGVIFGFIEGPSRGWTSPLVVIGLIGGVCLMTIFSLVESRVDHPILPLHLFRFRNFSGANLTTFAVYAAIRGASFLLVIFIQNVMDYSALTAGLLTAPTYIMLLVLSSFFSRQAMRLGPHLFMTFGPILIGVGLLVLAFVQPESNIWTGLMPGILIFGLGLSATVAPLTDTVMSTCPRKFSGTCSAFNTMVSRIAELLAVAVIGAILSIGFLENINRALISDSVPPAEIEELQVVAEDISSEVNEDVLSIEAVNFYEESFTIGFRNAMITASIFSVSGGAIAFFTIRNEELTISK